MSILTDLVSDEGAKEMVSYMETGARVGGYVGGPAVAGQIAHSLKNADWDISEPA